MAMTAAAAATVQAVAVHDEALAAATANQAVRDESAAQGKRSAASQ